MGVKVEPALDFLATLDFEEPDPFSRFGLEDDEVFRRAGRALGDELERRSEPPAELDERLPSPSPESAASMPAAKSSTKSPAAWLPESS
jgi:hypothetical protein